MKSAITFEGHMSLDTLAKLINIYADLVKLMPEFHADNYQGFLDWLVHSGYGKQQPGIEEVNKIMGDIEF